jgi:hypothetical protein
MIECLEARVYEGRPATSFYLLKVFLYLAFLAEDCLEEIACSESWVVVVNWGTGSQQLKFKLAGQSIVIHRVNDPLVLLLDRKIADLLN